VKAIVVGGTGFIGMNVVRALVARGWDVTATRRVRANTLFARKLGAKLVVGELDDVDSLVTAMAGQDVAFLCAGHYPRYSLHAEEELVIAKRRMQNMLVAAMRAKIGRVVYTGTVATIGPAPAGRKLSDERDGPNIEALEYSVYYRLKYELEMQVREAGKQGLDIVTLLPTGVFGELDVKAGTGFLLVGFANAMLPFYVDGKINVIDADDLAKAHIQAAIHGATGQRYIIGGHNVWVREILRTTANFLGVPFASWPLPLWAAAVLATFDEMRVVSRNKGERPILPIEFTDLARYGTWVNSAKANRELSLAPPTPFISTIRKACSWYERHRYIQLGEKPDENR
jgi:dihydroflavonol-4-reductase